jgi:hypothetical protein
VFGIIATVLAILGSMLLLSGIYAAIADAIVGAKVRNPEGDAIWRNGAWMLAGTGLLVLWYFVRMIG